MHSFWQSELVQNPKQFRSSEVVKIALEKGAVIPKDYPINDAWYD
jgi:hypothetical protein